VHLRNGHVAMATAAVVIAGLTACGGSDSSKGESAGGTTTSKPAEKTVTLGFVTHVKGDPFVNQIIDAAKAAADDLGADLKVAGTEQFDPNAELGLAQNFINAGAEGVALSIAGDSMANGLNDMLSAGKGVTTFNLKSTKVKAPYVGERSTNSGRILGKMILEKMGGAGASGTVVIGNCSPGLEVLENRARGVKESLSKASGVKILGPYDVKVEAADNFAAWQSLLAAHPETKAMIGLCAPDVASLGKLNAANGDKLVTGGYDLTAGNLKQIQEGHAYVTLGQNAFVQGYLPVKMLYDHATNDVPLEQGFLEAGTEIVTKDGVQEPYGLPKLTFSELLAMSQSPDKMRAYYTPLVKGKLADWSSVLKPLSYESK
jgi:ABC-type sugar transport system substrate-binding protein